MAIKVLVARKRLDSAKQSRAALDAKLTAAKTKRSKLRDDEAELEAAIDAAEEITPELEEQTDALNAAIEEADAAVAEVEAQITQADQVVAEAETALEEIEAAAEGAADGEPAPAASPDYAASSRSAAKFERRNYIMPEKIRSRSGCFDTREAREAFYSRSEVKNWIGAVRSQLKTHPVITRGVNGSSILIPEVVLEMLRDHINEHSKLLQYCTVKPVKGTSRQPVAGMAPEAVWMEMYADLNELNICFTDLEMDGFTVGGYFKVPNAMLDDSDINLGEELIASLFAAVGKAIDKAIVFGKGSAYYMPQGFVTRLAASSQPSWWGAKQGEFTDLHSSNVIKMDIGTSNGTSFFKTLILALGKADPKYSDGKLVWVMNRKTHLDIIARAMEYDSSAALVSQLKDEMPVIGGVIVELDDDVMQDYDIAGGYMSLQLMAEREGASVGSSDQQFFVQNQTVVKGYARYDGRTARGEGFVIVNYNNTDPRTEVSFAVDYANTKLNTLICTAAAGSATGKTVVTVSGTVAESATLKYKAKEGTGGIATGDTVDESWSELTSGTTAITAAAGCPIAVVELDGASRVISVGSVLSVPKTA